MSIGIDHVQLAMPAGREGAARAFYAGLLGIPEAPKLPALAQRGLAWFENGRVRIHLGVEGLRELVVRLLDAGVAVTDDEPLPGHDRVHGDDPFGNRLELSERRG
jgi:hypothetical protein